MTYTIKSSRQVEETIFTTVEYDFDGVIVEVEIPHFMPQSKEDIILGIENRAVSEQRKLDAIELNKIIIGEL